MHPWPPAPSQLHNISLKQIKMIALYVHSVLNKYFHLKIKFHNLILCTNRVYYKAICRLGNSYISVSVKNHPQFLKPSQDKKYLSHRTIC